MCQVQAVRAVPALAETALQLALVFLQRPIEVLAVAVVGQPTLQGRLGVVALSS